MSYKKIENYYRLESDRAEIAGAEEKNRFLMGLFRNCRPTFSINILENHPNLLEYSLNSNVFLYVLHPNYKDIAKYLDDKSKELYGYRILSVGILDKGANTIPMCAIKSGNINILKECIANGYDINMVNMHEDNLLSLLFEYESVEDIISNFEKKVYNYNDNMVFYDEEEKNIIFECAFALSENDDEEEKYRILKKYAEYEYNHFIDFLLTKNIDLLNNKNIEGMTPLLIAAKNNSIACDTIFDKIKKVDFNTVDRDGNNVLMLLVKNNNIEATQNVINNNNIPLNMVNKQGLNVRDLANQLQIKTIKRMLDNYSLNIFRNATNGISGEGLHI